MVHLADICRAAGPDYLDIHGERILASHRRALADLARCRTPALGASLYRCAECAELAAAYHSCANRHCPKCGQDRTRRWTEHLEARLLPGQYFLLTFTLPTQLRSLARSRQRDVYALLMREAAAATLELAGQKRWIGGRPGIVGVLHTWTRDLAFHPHVHLLVTAGGLSPDGAWRFPRHRRFLMPGYVLSRIFRARVRGALARLGLDRSLPQSTWRAEWVVHLQPAGDGQKVLRYLARYVHRVAITDDRIASFDGRSVAFRYRDRRTEATKTMALPVHDFLARFLQHVLPRRFAKVRHFGIFGTNQRARLEQARALLRKAFAREGRDAPEPSNQPLEPSRRPQKTCPACHKPALVLLGHVDATWTRGPP